MSNNGTLRNPSKWLRWTHEYMFSLNLVWIIVWHERVRTKMLGGRVLADYVHTLVGRASQLVSPIGGYTILEQLVWSFFLATVGFLILRLLSRPSITNEALRTVAGVASIAAFPVASLFFGLSFPACCAGASRFGLALELLVVLICGTLFYLRRRFISDLLLVSVLIFHFTMWAWVTSSYFNFFQFSDLRSSEYYHPWARTLAVLSLASVFHFGFPVFGFLAALTSVRYLTPTSESYAPSGS